MTQSAPSPQVLRRARLFWEQAILDGRSARDKHKASAHLESGYLSFQSALNALTAVCYLNGRFQLPNFSAVQMAGLCAEVDGSFDAIGEACAALDAVQQHSPFDAKADPAALANLSRESLAHGAHIVAAVRTYLKERRKRFFAP
jgi:hypothetical protein